MKRLVIMAAAIIALASPVIAKRHAIDANGNVAGVVVSYKTGARAIVGAAYAERFQAYINDLEQNYGAKIKFMGGIRKGHCSQSSMHPCGKALDICQLRRGIVDHRCHLPDRRILAEVAAKHGLVEGGRWTHSDYGHAQIGGYTGMTLAAMRNINSTSYSAKQHHHRTYRLAAYRPAPATHIGWSWSAL